MHRLALSLLAFYCALLPSLAVAAEVRPFYSRTLQPLTQVFGLPAATDGRLTPTGSTQGRLVLDAVSNFTENSQGTEEVLLDGETYRLNLALCHGFAPRWEVGLDLPLVAHNGGVFDGFIEGWHDFFGMPQGGRDQRDHDLLEFRYRNGTATELDYGSDSLGLGDVSLLLGYQLLPGSPDNPRSLALRSGVKLPTGDSDRLLGSGGTDVYLQLAGSDDASLRSLDISLFGSAGLLWLSDGDVLAERQRNWAVFGSAGLGWRPLDWIAFKLQVDSHSAFFHSALRELGTSAQLVFGGSLYFGDGWTMDIGVSEDVAVDTAPDVGLHLALGRSF